MARIRTLKPELWLSPQVMNLSHGARLLFIGLITQADDEGRGSADVRRLKAAVFPGDDCTRDEVAAWLAEIEDQTLVICYSGNGHGPLYELPSWTDHQKVDHPRPSHYPASDPALAKSRETVAKPREALANIRGGSTRARGSDRILSEGSEGSLTRTRAREGARREEEPAALGAVAEQWLKGGTA